MAKHRDAAAWAVLGVVATALTVWLLPRLHPALPGDWTTNRREATAIASYSPRARPGAPVAWPIAWDELETLAQPLRESVREAPRRMAMPDPWADFEASRRPLTRSALARVLRAR